MSFRTRVMLAIGLSTGLAVVGVSYAISVLSAQMFEQADEARRSATVRQLRRELDLRAREVERRVRSAAASPNVLRMAGEAHAEGDLSFYLDTASTLARDLDLDFLEILSPGGDILSSAQYPARFGYRKPWVTTAGTRAEAFATEEELPDGKAIGLIAISRAAPPLLIVGGQRLDRGFVEDWPLPQGVTVELRRGPGDAPAPRQARLPLAGLDGTPLAELVVTSSRRELDAMLGSIRRIGLGGALCGLLAGALVAWRMAARVTRPVRELSTAAGALAAGNWEVTVPEEGSGEIGTLATAFNRMTADLRHQRDRLIQAERVAAWRDLARRLAHELKNPLFPLQITVENLQKSRDLGGEQFDEVFRESTSTLAAELAQLREVAGRFSDFAKMPPPEFEPVSVYGLVQGAVRLFEAQWNEPSRPVTAQISVEPAGLEMDADGHQLGRALRNLLLNATEAMTSGGSITVRAWLAGETVVIEVADTGPGFTPEESARIFTPYYTTRKQGTGLGLAIVQSVVTDHGGRISVTSTPGEGANFRLELPKSRKT